MSADAVEPPSVTESPLGASLGYSSLDEDIRSTIPQRLVIDRDSWTGPSARRVLRGRRASCIDTLAPNRIAEETAIMSRSSAAERDIILSLESECAKAAVRQKILLWNQLTLVHGGSDSERPCSAGAFSPPPRRKVRKRHTISGGSQYPRPRWDGGVVSRRGDGAGSRRGDDTGSRRGDVSEWRDAGPPLRPGDVEVRTWETRRNGGRGDGSARCMSSVSRSSSGRGHLQLLSDEQPVPTQSVATQTLHVAKSLRKGLLSGNDVYVVRVRAPPKAMIDRNAEEVVYATPHVNGRSTSDSRHAAVHVKTSRNKDPTGRPPRLLSLDGTLDFNRDPPSFSSFNSAGSDGGHDDRSDDLKVNEAINHNVLLPARTVDAATPPLPPPPTTDELTSQLTDLDRTFSLSSIDQSPTGSVNQAFCSEFAAQMARESTRAKNSTKGTRRSIGSIARSKKLHDDNNEDGIELKITAPEAAKRSRDVIVSRPQSNVENYNLVEEVTDSGRTVMRAPDDLTSLTSSGCDMADVGVARFPTPSTAGTTPTPSVSPTLASETTEVNGVEVRSQQHSVVVAIDFGTTYSGYAFSFTRQPKSVHIMRRSEGGDPGLYNQKTPTALLLRPDGSFAAFGFAARDAYHDLDTKEASSWLYFDKFKLSLHRDSSLSLDTYIPAANGQCISALIVFAHALSHFRQQTQEELGDILGHDLQPDQIRWVITVPAIWKQHAKQFMRQAAYQAGLCSKERGRQLLIALEPEVASVYCQSLRLHDLVHETRDRKSVFASGEGDDNTTGSAVHMVKGTRYLVVDCGGGTVDITVHEVLDSEKRRLKELYKASGGPYGSVGVDIQFEQLLCDVFGSEFICSFEEKRPASWIDLMVAFEARKRSAAPNKSTPLNVALPFTFISEYKRIKGKKVEQAVKNYKNPSVRYTDGVLRLDPKVMLQLFIPTLDKIVEQVRFLLDDVKNLQYLFLVGGFSESKLLQHRVKQEFSDRLRVVIPQDVSLAILRGAVLYGIDPAVIQVRRSTMTYGVGVLNKFIRGIHPNNKLLVRDGREWCADVFDKFVLVDQSMGVGETLLRRYTPAKPGQRTIVLHIYCTHKEKVTFVTDQGVQRCGTLKLTLDEGPPSPTKKREIQVRMLFGDTEVRASAIDISSKQVVSCDMDFIGF